MLFCSVNESYMHVFAFVSRTLCRIVRGVARRWIFGVLGFVVVKLRN